MKKKLFVLDVSGFIFRAYFALPPMSNARGEPTNALFGFIRSVLKLFKDFSPDYLVAVYDGPDNKKARTALYSHYKANRTRAIDGLPEQIERSSQVCALLGIPQIELEGVEADDAMGSIAKWAVSEGMEVYLCTGDKDLCQLIGEDVYALNPWKDNLILDSKKVEETFGVPPEQIIDYLAIVGDSSDNIPGLSGFGPKTAVQLLKQFGSLEAILAHPEEVAGAKKQETLIQEADVARLSKQLATIHVDLDFPKDSSLFKVQPPDIIGLREFYLDMGFTSLVKELEEVFKEKRVEERVSYRIIDSEEDLYELVDILSRHHDIAFSLVSTHFKPLLALPVGIGFSMQAGSAYYVPLNGTLGPDLPLSTLKPLFENPDIGFFSHDVKYDLHSLANVGIQIANINFDTSLASYLLTSSQRKHTLDHLCLHYFGKIKTTFKSLIGSGKKEIKIEDVPLDKVADFCCEDVDYTFRLKQILSDGIHERKLDSLLFNLEMPLMHVLYKMERTGVYLDVDKLISFSKENAIELHALEQEIYALAGEEFNINSPKQLSEILFQKMGIKSLKKTATGLSTRADVLEILAEEHQIAEKILSFRTLEKLRSTYIETLPHEVHPATKRIHPTFSQSVAATGRLACQDPNLQNIPVRTAQGRKIREAFQPQKRGWSYVAADYSQIELRLLAHLSEDPHLIKAFLQGEDIHAYTASLVLKVPIEEVTPLQRHQAKAINFGIIYGQQAYGLSQELGIDIKEAAAFIEAYFARYPKVKSFIEQCIEKARKTGKTVTINGREREIPEINSSNAIARNAAERLAINAPLQGTAADVIKLAMLDIDHLLTQKKMHSKMILQIHDELIFEAPDEEIDTLAAMIKKSMEGVMALKVPLLVQIIIGKNWAEC